MSVKLSRVLADLCLEFGGGEGGFLTQFWLPRRDGSGNVELSTQGLPYVVHGTGDLLALFRCVCCKVRFGSDPLDGPALGPVGRVYVSGLPESCEDYADIDPVLHPHGAEARRCHIRTSLFLPITSAKAGPAGSHGGAWRDWSEKTTGAAGSEAAYGDGDAVAYGGDGEGGDGGGDGVGVGEAAPYGGDAGGYDGADDHPGLPFANPAGGGDYATSIQSTFLEGYLPYPGVSGTNEAVPRRPAPFASTLGVLEIAQRDPPRPHAEVAATVRVCLLRHGLRTPDAASLEDVLSRPQAPPWEPLGYAEAPPTYAPPYEGGGYAPGYGPAAAAIGDRQRYEPGYEAAQPPGAEAGYGPGYEPVAAGGYEAPLAPGYKGGYGPVPPPGYRGGAAQRAATPGGNQETGRIANPDGDLPKSYGLGDLAAASAPFLPQPEGPDAQSGFGEAGAELEGGAGDGAPEVGSRARRAAPSTADDAREVAAGASDRATAARPKAAATSTAAASGVAARATGGGGGGGAPASASVARSEDSGEIGTLISEASASDQPTRTEVMRYGPEGSSLTLSDLESNFGYGLKVAAQRLGVCASTLKRASRRFGIKRWPHRAIRKLAGQKARAEGGMSGGERLPTGISVGSASYVVDGRGAISRLPRATSKGLAASGTGDPAPAADLDPDPDHQGESRTADEAVRRLGVASPGGRADTEGFKAHPPDAGRAGDARQPPFHAAPRPRPGRPPGPGIGPQATPAAQGPPRPAARPPPAGPYQPAYGRPGATLARPPPAAYSFGPYPGNARGGHPAPPARPPRLAAPYGDQGGGLGRVHDPARYSTGYAPGPYGRGYDEAGYNEAAYGGEAYVGGGRRGGDYGVAGYDGADYGYGDEAYGGEAYGGKGYDGEGYGGGADFRGEYEAQPPAYAPPYSSGDQAPHPPYGGSSAYDGERGGRPPPPYGHAAPYEAPVYGRPRPHETQADLHAGRPGLPQPRHAPPPLGRAPAPPRRQHPQPPPAGRPGSGHPSHPGPPSQPGPSSHPGSLPAPPQPRGHSGGRSLPAEPTPSLNGSSLAGPGAEVATWGGIHAASAPASPSRPPGDAQRADRTPSSLPSPTPSMLNVEAVASGDPAPLSPGELLDVDPSLAPPHLLDDSG